MRATGGASSNRVPAWHKPLVIFNPAAGPRRRRDLRSFLAPLSAAGLAVTVCETGGRGDAEARAATAAREGYDLVVAAGGDGTINEIVNGLALGPLPLAICPLGTANVLALEIGLGASMQTAADSVLVGSVRRVALGRAGGRRFVMMAGVGFDAHVVAGVRPAVKRTFGRGAYVLESLRQLVLFPYPRYRLRIDGVWHECASAVIAKGHYYGGAFVCAPDARLDRPDFQACLFLRGGALAVASYACALARGSLARRGDVRLVAARHVIIDGPPGDPVQADGDTIARLPVEITVDAASIDLVVPASGRNQAGGG
jgi:YegS/Rv2252/BmrU family lipid kinase